MNLTVNIAQERVEKLQKLASCSGRSMEEVATELLQQKLDTAIVDAALSAVQKRDHDPRWGHNGVPWDRIPRVQRALIEQEAYAKHPLANDEFPVHPDDVGAFEQERW